MFLGRFTVGLFINFLVWVVLGGQREMLVIVDRYATHRGKRFNSGFKLPRMLGEVAEFND
jgi:hypothetical protein